MLSFNSHVDPGVRSRPEMPLLPVKPDSQRATPLVKGWVGKTPALGDKRSFSLGGWDISPENS